MPSNTVTMMELAAHFGMKTLVGSIKALSRTIAAPEMIDQDLRLWDFGQTMNLNVFL